MTTFAFALSANIQASEQRRSAKPDGTLDGSDNVNYITYASAFARAIADPIICARFWSHVDKDGPIHPLLGTRCWLWTANVVGHGNKTDPVNSRHGQFTYRLRPSSPWSGRLTRQHHVYAHRFAWGMAHGVIPCGLLICHHCDVPPCVNDAHHFLGTQADNIQDARRKGRLSVPHVRRVIGVDWP